MDRSPVDRILEEWNAVTNQARRPDSPPRRATVRSGLAGAGLAGASLLVVGALIAVVWLGRPGTGPGTGSVGGSPSTAPSPTATALPTPSAGPSATPAPSAAPVATPSPTPTESPPRTAGACEPVDLAARITSWEGAAGSRIANVELTNTGSGSCSIRTLDRPQLVDGKGSVLIDGSNPSASATLKLAPGDVVKALVRDSNYCGPDPVAPVSVAFVLRGGGRVVATPVSPTDATVPPCNGDPGSPGSIDMQAWAR